MQENTQQEIAKLKELSEQNKSVAYNPNSQENMLDTTVNTQTNEPEQTPTSTDKITINSVEYDKDLTVFKTKTGKVVHKEGCRHLVGRQGISSMTLGTAIAAGIEPCSDCF